MLETFINFPLFAERQPQIFFIELKSLFAHTKKKKREKNDLFEASDLLYEFSSLIMREKVGISKRGNAYCCGIEESSDLQV